MRGETSPTEATQDTTHTQDTTYTKDEEVQDGR